VLVAETRTLKSSGQPIVRPLSEWIQQYGTENQKQRLGAGLLPWQEAHEAVDEYFFIELDHSFPRHKRFDVAEVCICIQTGSSCRHVRAAVPVDRCD
jgi:hypothetical protein